MEKIRVSKLMSEQGICSRREADSYIERGWVLVDGVPVTELGMRVFPNQRITLAKAAQSRQEASVTILLNKPIGFVSGQAEQGYRPAITLITAQSHFSKDRSPLRFNPAHLKGLAPAGRLDIDSTGLLILTQDGRIAKQLIGEHSGIDKEYLVRVEGLMDKPSGPLPGMPESFPTRVGPAGPGGAIVLACKSRQYFAKPLAQARCPLLIATTGLMAPEAYVLDAILQSWTTGADEPTMHQRAAEAYARYQKCSLAAAKALFVAGGK